MPLILTRFCTPLYDNLPFICSQPPTQRGSTTAVVDPNTTEVHTDRVANTHQADGLQTVCLTQPGATYVIILWTYSCRTPSRYGKIILRTSRLLTRSSTISVSNSPLSLSPYLPMFLTSSHPVSVMYSPSFWLESELYADLNYNHKIEVDELTRYLLYLALPVPFYFAQNWWVLHDQSFLISLTWSDFYESWMMV